MADTAHLATDKELEKMERHLSAIYARAEKELAEKAETYFKRFEELDAKKRALVDSGKLTEKEYKRWRQNKIMTGKHWTDMKEQVAQELARVNETALEYVNGRLPNIYAINYNGVGEAIESAVNGYSFELVDASTVKHLATADRKLLPYKHLDIAADKRWNMQTFQSEVLQGIIQGESVQDISKRIFPEIMSKTDLTGKTAKEAKAIVRKNKQAAIRNARTMVTSAENKGRMDMLHDAADKGVITHKVWTAAIDARTREAHRLLDGQEQDIDDPFESELGPIMYPGDVEADPANVYNCRCTLTYKVVGFGKSDAERAFGSISRSYADELVEKQYSPNISEYKSAEEYWDAKKAWSGDQTKYVDDMFEPGKFTSEAAWGGNRNEKISRIEGTIADLNDKYPALMSGNSEYGTRLEHLTVCDYSRAWEFLPNGELDRRLTDSASAQVFIVNEKGKSRVVIAFNRPYLTETIEETIQNRQRAIEAGEVLSSIGYSPEATAIHEWGHVMSQHLDNAMIYQDETVVDYWNWYKSLTKDEIRQGLSDYATTNRGEFEAECFAEMHMPNPRPLALRFKEYLDEIIGKGY